MNRCVAVPGLTVKLFDVPVSVDPVLVAVRRNDAVRAFQSGGETYKAELLEGISDDPVSFYRQDGFQDMCRGPHLPSTGWIKAVKLLSTSGAYC